MSASAEVRGKMHPVYLFLSRTYQCKELLTVCSTAHYLYRRVSAVGGVL